MAKNEIDLAKSASNGYSRNFELPVKISGNSYTIRIINNRELVVNYIDKEHVSFLQENVCGDVLVPGNEISKENGVTCANSNLNREQCQSAQDMGLCDSIDEELLPGTKCCCCSRYTICC